VPTQTPTDAPTTLPPTTDEPSFAPSATPTHDPTASPTASPTEVRTISLSTRGSARRSRVDTMMWRVAAFNRCRSRRASPRSTPRLCRPLRRRSRPLRCACIASVPLSAPIVRRLGLGVPWE
jgi:hypothetical protein